MKEISRKKAIKHWEWNDRKEKINENFNNIKIMYNKPNQNYITEKV